MAWAPPRFGSLPGTSSSSGLMFVSNRGRLLISAGAAVAFAAVGVFLLIVGFGASASAGSVVARLAGCLLVIVLGPLALIACGRAARPGGMVLTPTGMSFRVGRSGFSATWDALEAPQWRNLSGTLIMCLRPRSGQTIQLRGRPGAMAAATRQMLDADVAIPVQNIDVQPSLFCLTVDHFFSHPQERRRLGSADVVDYVVAMHARGRPGTGD